MTEAPFPRFDRVERVLHWSNATLFFVLILTGAALKVEALSTLVANRHFVKNLHVYAGLVLPVPVLIALLIPAGRQFRRDLARVNRWSEDDRQWWSRRTRAGTQLGKFNPGQKLNTVFTGAVIVVMLATGAIMRWYEPFSDSWRTGATFVHDATWLVVMVVVIGHIAIATSDPLSLRSMRVGWVPESWAREKRTQWWSEIADARGASAHAGGDVAAGGEERRVEAGVATGQVAVGTVEEMGAGDRVGEPEL
jgi:formate dehydrogenase subunit gamma